MKKHLPALLAALAITLAIGLGMIVMGGNAALNRNGVPIQDSPGPSVGSNTDPAGQVEQYQSLVAQYQEREGQYQDQLNAVQQQLDQASETIQQYQRVLLFLQRRGLIQIDRNGRVFLPDD